MENSSNISVELSAEFVLSHVIDNVCRFLEIKDLYSVAKVCSLWQNAALHEMRRLGPKVGVVPYFDEAMYISCDSKFNLLDMMHTKPHIALLFFNRSHYRQRHALDEKELHYVINIYKQQLECNIVALQSEETYFDTNPRVDFVDFRNLTTNDNFCIPSLFLSIFKQSNLIISYCMKEYGISSAIFAQRMYKELVSNYEDSKITLILFSASQKGTNIATKLLSMIKKNHEQNKYSIWGNECYSLKTVHYNPTDNQDIIEPNLIGIRICGPSIDSWSFIFDASLKSDKFQEYLLKFKENIKLKQHSLGLACGPVLTPDRNDSLTEEMQDSSLIMKLIKKVFPEIPFIGEFSYEFYFTAYGCDSTSNTSNMEVGVNRVSIMIITYD